MQLSNIDSKVKLAAAFSGAICVLAVAWRRQRRLARLPPGSFGWPVIGEMLEYVTKGPEAFVERRLAKHGGTFKTNVVLSPMVFVRPTPANVKVVFSLRDLGWPDHWLDVLGRTALPMVNDPHHKRIRTVSGRAFTAAQLESYLPVFAELTREHVSRWQRAGMSEMRPAVKLYTFDLAQHVILGERFPEELTRRCSELFDLTCAGFECMLPYSIPGSFWRKTQQARKELVKIYQEVIQRHRAALATGQSSQTSMIDMVMSAQGQEGGQPTDIEVQDFCVAMIFAAHDTTLATVQGMLHYLKVLPSLEERLRAEVDVVWDGKAPVTRKLMEMLPTCRAFIMEVLRIVPPVGAVIRQCKTDLDIDGYVVPAGMKIAVGSASVAQNFFGAQDAAEFRIDRYLDHAGSFIDRTYETAAFAAFGGGGRMCIGYKFALDELLVFLMTILRCFEFDVQTLEQVHFPIRSWQVKASFAQRT